MIKVREAHGEARSLTKDDVWGKFTPDHKRLTAGMIIAKSDDICPVFKDKVPYKSVTVLCEQDQIEDVMYWLEYVHGGGCVQRAKGHKGKIAIRSDYMCW